MRLALGWLLVGVGLAGCSPEVSLGSDLQHAGARASFQTAPAAVLVYEGDVPQPYEVLGDVEVTLRQRSAFGEVPTRELGIRALQEQAGRLGAHAIVMVSFGEMGMSLWSYQELRGHGRAVRFR